jgi:hypothetical protein
MLEKKNLQKKPVKRKKTTHQEKNNLLNKFKIKIIHFFIYFIIMLGTEIPLSIGQYPTSKTLIRMQFTQSLKHLLDLLFCFS